MWKYALVAVVILGVGIVATSGGGVQWKVEREPGTEGDWWVPYIRAPGQPWEKICNDEGVCAEYKTREEAEAIAKETLRQMGLWKEG